MVRILIILCFSFTLSQNFLYDSDDWYILKDPGSIYSITEGPFKVYFGSENASKEICIFVNPALINFDDKFSFNLLPFVLK